MKYTDKTDDEWDDLVEQWHTSDTKISLENFLQLDNFEYRKMVFGIRDDSITEEELSKYQKDLVTFIVNDIKNIR